jgi:hypothetical protein
LPTHSEGGSSVGDGSSVGGVSAVGGGGGGSVGGSVGTGVLGTAVVGIRVAVRVGIRVLVAVGGGESSWVRVIPGVNEIHPVGVGEGVALKVAVEGRVTVKRG